MKRPTQTPQVKMNHDLLTWFREELLPVLIKNGNFSDNGRVESLQKCEFEDIEKGSNFASAPCFAKLTFNTPKGPMIREIIVKFQCQDPVFREKMKLLLQFQNEVNMFTEILPAYADFLKSCGQSESMIQEVIPKCYFAKHEVPNKSILILDDLRKDGYRLSTSVTELDLEHCLIVLERLAQFHAVSLAMKFRKWNSFEKLKTSFANVWFEDNEELRKQCEDFTAHCSTRGIDYLMSQRNSEVPVTYLEKLKEMLRPSCLFDLLRHLRTPTEPLSVISHGDFNRNNILYRYNNGKPIDAKLIDFQTYLYGSPCLDLSFFIYMNTTLALREKHFDDIFKHYHSSLIKTVSLILKESEESIAGRLPLEAFKMEFGRVAITGYVTAAFFLPMMMAPREVDFEKDMLEKSFKELALETYVQGGEVVSQRIADIIIDFHRRKFYT